MTSEASTQWYSKIGWVILACIVFPPLGLYGFWKNRSVRTGWRVLLCFFCLGISALVYTIGWVFSIPNDTIHYANAETCLEKKDYDGAILEYTKAIKENPQFAEAYFARGILYYDRKEYDKALMDYGMCLQFSPKNAKAFFNRALVKNSLNYSKSAIEDYSKSIQINPNQPDAYNNRGRIKNLLKDYNSAISDFDKSIELDPKNYMPHFNRGISNFSLDHNASALQDLDKAIVLNPDCSDCYDVRGVIKTNMGGNKDSACEDFRESVERGHEAAAEHLKEFCK